MCVYRIYTYIHIYTGIKPPRRSVYTIGPKAILTYSETPAGLDALQHKFTSPNKSWTVQAGRPYQVAGTAPGIKSGLRVPLDPRRFPVGS